MRHWRLPPLSLGALLRRTSFRDERKLLVGVGVLLLSIVLLLSLALWSLATVVSSQKTLNDRYTQNLLLAQTLREQRHQQLGLVPMYIMTRDEVMFERLQGAGQAFTATLVKLRAMPGSVRSRGTLDHIGRLQAALSDTEATGIRLFREGASASEVNEFFRKNAGPKSIEITAEINRYAQDASAAYDAERDRNDSLFRDAFVALMVASAACLATFLSVVVLLLREQDRRRELEEARTRLLQREKEISRARKEAIEVVSHDLRSPLTAIIFASEMLQEKGTLRTDKETRLVNTMFTSAHSMHQLILNLLDHTKIESQSLDLNISHVDVIALVRRVEARFQIVAARKSVHLLNDFDDADLRARFDEFRIEQVLANLIGNAVKFTPPGGRVRVSGEASEDGLWLQVADTGIGMTAEEVEKTFERYWQAKDTASLGTGLGMAISKAIVEAHRGSISVQSAPGEGSVFSICLPLRAA